jgi:hypothetical protein
MRSIVRIKHFSKVISDWGSRPTVREGWMIVVAFEPSVTVGLLQLATIAEKLSRYAICGAKK